MSGPPEVTTRYGRLRGVELDGVVAFLGVPYAAAPDDPDLARFGPPAPLAPWSGVRSATELGPIAPQVLSGPGSYLPGERFSQDEECRTLNVWAPAANPGHLPVVVFVHGGAFLNGSGASTLYRGDRLARGGAVVVTINYRLGALGFLAHPGLAHPAMDGCANFGLADQLAALAFVRDHAAAFGGDPDNVAVFGESAGAISVCALLGMPAARGLFRRAIVQSGMALARPMALAAPLAEQLARVLGLAGVARDGLLRAPLDELLAAQQQLSGAIDEGVGIPFAPVIDGGLLDRHPADLVASGAGSPGAELLAGTNHDEFTLFSFASPLVRDLDEDGLRALVGRYLASAGLRNPPLAGDVVACYRRARQRRGEPAAPRSLLDAFGTDWLFRIPLLRLLEAHGRHGAATFAYRFDWPTPFGGGALGACHGIELPFVFGTLEEPLVGLFTGTGEEPLRLSRQVRAAWLAFAATGDPSSEVLGRWPVYEPSRRQTMVLGATCAVEEAPGEDGRRFFEDHLGRYGVDGPAEGAQARSLAFLGPVLPEDGSAGTDSGGAQSPGGDHLHGGGRPPGGEHGDQTGT